MDTAASSGQLARLAGIVSAASGATSGEDGWSAQAWPSTRAPCALSGWVSVCLLYTSDAADDM
eukprot:1265864-Alexandrium_andersonii.AAC.1